MEILILLRSLDLSLTEITKSIGKISSPEVSRHVTALSEQGLVCRDSATRKYRASDYGITLTTMLEPLQFIVKHKEYFQNHRLDDLPTALVTQINLLTDAEVFERVGTVMLELEKMINSADRELWAIIDSGFTFKSEKVQTMKVITNPEFLYSTQNDEFVKSEFKNSYPSLESVTYRVLPKIHIALLIVDKDKSGAIGFSKTGEFKPDYSTMFFTDKKDGLYYLQTIFQYFWDQAQLP
jgi:predicted transcriptional regulator